MRLTTSGILFIVATALVAGCLGGSTETVEVSSTEEPEELVEPTFDETTGAIRGLVTDDTLAPVVSALVTLDDGSSTRSTARGAFGFSNVAPGTRTLEIVQDGFEPGSVDVEVARGLVAEVAVQLASTAAPGAYHETLIGDAFVSCAFWYSGPLPAPFDYAQMGCNWLTLVAGQNPVDQDGTRFLVTPFGDVEALVMETTWQPGQALGQQADILWLVAIESGDATVTGVAIASARGASPATTQANRSHVDERIEDRPGVLCDDFECTVWAYHAAYQDGTGATVIAQQRFTDYLSVFHGSGPAAGFSALPDE